jgi:hypothetical protein
MEQTNPDYSVAMYHERSYSNIAPDAMGYLFKSTAGFSRTVTWHANIITLSPAVLVTPLKPIQHESGFGSVILEHHLRGKLSNSLVVPK